MGGQETHDRCDLLEEDAGTGKSAYANYGCAMRRWKVRRIRSARRRTPNLLSKLETWNFTVRSAMLSLLAISLFERFSRSESRTSCSGRLRFVTASVFRRRHWPMRMESTKPDRTERGTQKPPTATSGKARINCSRAST